MKKTIEDIFYRYSPKSVRGGYQYRMMCPFRDKHSTAAPGEVSFFITPDINAYHCFSCGSHGSLLALMTGGMFKVPFMDAVELVSFDNFERILNPKEREASVLETIIPMNAPDAFIKRGFTERLLRQFKVGSDGEHIYIPVYDNEGVDMVAIKHRIGHDFWYTPEGFPKEQFLFNIAAAKRSQKNAEIKRCVLVEGETDTFRSCQNGIWNVVGQMGGGLSDEQAELLNWFDEVYLALDNDSAGTKYAEIAERQLRKQDVDTYVMLYDADDPGKCEMKEWQRAYSEPVTYAEYTYTMSFLLGEEYEKIIPKRKKFKR